MASEDPRRVAVRAAVEAASESGCPVAGSTLSAFENVADIALRRWDSVGRRSPIGSSADARSEDLAKVLRDRIEADQRLVGPLMKDYRHLARCIGEVLSAGN